MKHVFAVILILQLFGCASVRNLTNNQGPPPKPREEQLSDYYNPKIGQTEEQIIEEFGIPTESYAVGKIKVISFKESLGFESHGAAFKGWASASSHEVFHKVSFFIKDGKVDKWKVNERD